MIKVRFYSEDSTGLIVYHSRTKELMVSHPNRSIRDKVRKYLTNERVYTTSRPKSTEIGRQLVKATPTDNIEYLEMALCEMNSKLGLWVDWSDSNGGSTAELSEVPTFGTVKSLATNKIYEVVNNTETDLEKSKGKREGLIQTVVTYVRNGKTITRKQWVRSEYAQHAKKNEEEKKEAMVRKLEREEEKKKRELEEIAERDTSQDDREKRKLEKRQMEYTHGGLEHMDEVLREYYKAMKKKRIEEQQEKKELEEKAKSKKRSDEKEEKKEDRGAFNQQDSTKEANRRELEIRL